MFFFVLNLSNGEFLLSSSRRPYRIRRRAKQRATTTVHSKSIIITGESPIYREAA